MTKILGGPPGAAAGLYWGAAVVSGGTALVQLAESMCTNSFRALCADANKVLIAARIDGIAPPVLQGSQRLCNKAIGAQEKDLLRQVVEAFEVEFGVQRAAGFKAMYDAI